MPRFVKDIVRAGRYKIGDRFEEVTPERLQKWARNFSKQREAGLSIPAPCFHEKTKSIPAFIGSDREGFLKKSTDNLGFWESLYYDPDAKALRGVIDAPGDVNDPNTPAGKIGQTIRETSIYVAKQWQDGSGRVWDDEPVMHIACVTHPVEGGQSNFQPASEDGLAIAMSFYSEEESDKEEQGEPAPQKPEANGSAKKKSFGSNKPEEVHGSEPLEVEPNAANSIASLLPLLEKHAGVKLPTDTSDDNFVERLMVALTQLSANDEDEVDGGSVFQPPKEAGAKTAPFIMSFTTDQQKAIVAAKVVNPATGKPFTLEEIASATAPAQATITDDVLMSSPTVGRLLKTTDGLMKTLTKTTADGFKVRIEALKRKLGPKAVEHLVPMVEGLEMSFGSDGQPNKPQVALLLESLEEAAKHIASSSLSANFDAAVAMSSPAGTVVVDTLPHPENDPSKSQAQMSDEQQTAIFNRLKRTGVLS